MKTLNPAEELAVLLDTGPTVTLAMAAWDKVAVDFQMQRLELSEDLAEEFAAIAATAVRYLGESHIRAFDAGYKADSGEVQVLALADAEEIRAVVSELRSPGRLARFKNEPTFVKNVKFYAATVEKGRASAVFIRSYGRAKALAQSGSFAAFFTGEVYDIVDDSALLFDQSIDMIAWGDQLYIFNDAQFRRIFRIAEALREQTLEALTAMTSRFPIKNFDEFAAACLGQVQMMSKAMGIPGKSYFQTLTMADVKRVIRDFRIPLVIEIVDGSEALVFDGALDQRWHILKVLDDDYLRSGMTDLRYEVNSKAQWQ